MKRLLIATTSIISVFSSVHAFADVVAPTPDVAGQDAVGTDEIVVTATRTPQNLDRIGASISVITPEMIEMRQTVVVSDILKTMPGVTFSRAGGVGGVTTLNIRGAETDQTTIIIDGVKLNDPSATGGGYNLANLMTGDIERIEILRGAQSTLWGSQAIGGVVNIVTVDPTAPFEASGQVEGGSFGTGYGEVGAGGKDGRLTWRVAGDYYTTDGVSAYVNGTEPDGYRNAGVTGRLRYDVTDDVSIDLRSVFSHGRNKFDGFPPPLYAFADDREYGTTDQFVGYAGVNFDVLDGRLRNRVAYSYTSIDTDLFDPDQAVTTRTFDSSGRNSRFEYQGSLSLFEGWNLVFGAEHERSSFVEASPSSFAPNPAPATASAEITSGYGQLQAEVIPGLTLTGGLRFDSHDTFGSRMLGQAAAAWAINDGNTVLRASFGQGFKAPTLYQLFSEYGNTKLSPEDANSWDGGVEQHLFDGMLTMSATGFYRNTHNQIGFVSCPSTDVLCTPGKFGVYENIAQTRAEGVELTAAAKVDQLNLTANYTLTDTKNTAPGSLTQGKELARRPENVANLSADYNFPLEIAAGTTISYVGKSFDDAANTFVLHAYTLVDLHASWKATENFEVYGRVENLFDESYATVRNYGTLGRGVYAGIRAKF